MTQTVAGQMYNNHVKSALLSGKPVELSMKDFLPKSQHNNKQKQNQKSEFEKEIMAELKRFQSEYAGYKNIHLRGSLLQSHVMEMMTNAESMDEVKEIYSIYKNVVWHNPI
ncbi:hypothetical protein [Paenibacillus xylaniclasticus]|uniref:hypothetical protein n=1 Tax=Paenibacillus xylaniclasticus TaxID=588083 RepID=UPI000FD7D833|nr:MULTISPECIES: hypothetical protein [Paenibacillus]GFN32547.1 hypothetical protein PCURB6_28070 [Paenibacillus curdlanolyticus]